MHIKPDMCLDFFNAPDDIGQLLGNLSENTHIAEGPGGNKLERALAFIETRKTLEANLNPLGQTLKIRLAFCSHSTKVPRKLIPSSPAIPSANMLKARN